MKILKEKYYPLSRIVCFTSPDAIEKRIEHQEEENLLKIDHFIQFPYEDYRNLESEFFQEVENILSEEMKSADILIDLTPLSKLFSFKFLEGENLERKQHLDLVNIFVRITGVLNHQAKLVFIEIGELLIAIK